MNSALLLACIVAFLPHSNPGADESTLVVEVSNLSSSRGSLMVALFATKEAFDKNLPCAYKILNLVDEQGPCYFTGLIPGEVYAIKAFHDENNNGVLDQNILGIPKEGFAFSNNVVPRFSAPAFSDCRFQLQGRPAKANLKMQYL